MANANNLLGAALLKKSICNLHEPQHIAWVVLNALLF